jgi:hypothetical protein
LAAATANAAVMTMTLGDKDGLGFSLTPGQTVPTLPFDNRTASDPTFTDFATAGETNAYFTFTFTPIEGTINSIDLEFGLSGIEDAHNDSGQPDWNDRLFVDTVEVANAFDTAYTGWNKYGVIHEGVPSDLFGLVADGTAAFFFDGQPLGLPSNGRPRLGDQVSFDYVTLTVDYTEPVSLPVPPTALLVLAGLLALPVVRRLSS